MITDQFPPLPHPYQRQFEIFIDQLSKSPATQDDVESIAQFTHRFPHTIERIKPCFPSIG